ncbi:MAG: hypothetical protein ACR2II_09445 [Chthoniobacterales bacterium]
MKMIPRLAVTIIAVFVARLDAHAQLNSLSNRTFVGTGNEIAINEFVVAGTGNATVLVRGLGPSFNGVLPDALQNPTLVLADSSGNVIGSNDNWKETQETQIAATGLAPSDDLESAILATLAPGSYVVIERGKNATTGTGLNEIYDLNPTGGKASIIAFGARGQVDSGTDTNLVSGIVLASQEDLLVRTLGPSIGLAGTLADPTLSVFDMMGMTIAQNDDWQAGGQQFEIQNSGLAPDNPAEAAAIATFASGSYVMFGSAKAGASGIIFNQFYILPYNAPDLDPIPPTPTPTPTPNPTPTPTPSPTPSPSPTPNPSPAPQKLLNISTRLRVLTGDNVLIGGFIVTGTEPKKVILRAIGPSLGTANPPVPGALADTILELHESDGTVVTNDDWKDTQEAEIMATTLQPTNPLESAIVATLDPGAYTAIVSGKNGNTGVGLVEAYDLDQAADSQLANISTRGFVETGDNVMIGGFIVDGGALGLSTSVLVRGIGPSLAEGNPPVPGALVDPTLELHDINGAIVASNDNWQDTQKDEIIATTIPPTNDLESAILAPLTAGAYTVILSGKDGGTGVALIEVYNFGSTAP